MVGIALREDDDAAKIGGMDRQTLRDWAHRFNAAGLEGLVNRAAPGVARKLSPAPLKELAEIVETGPDPRTHKIVRWRRVDLQAAIAERFGVVLHQRSVSRLPHELGFAHLSARPRHPAQDLAMLETFKKTSRSRSPRRSLTCRRARRSSCGGRRRCASG